MNSRTKAPATWIATLAIIALLAITGAAKAASSDTTDERFAPGGLLEGFQPVPGNGDEDAYYSAPRSAPAGSVSNVSVTLVMEKGNYPLYGVLVLLYKPKSVAIYKATTGLNGVAVFPSIASGTYNLALVGLPPSQVPKNAPKTLAISKTGNTTIKTNLSFSGRTHDQLMFGDSNTTPLPPDSVGFDVLVAQDHSFANFSGFSLTERDFALGNTPMAQWPGANYGLGLVLSGESQFPAAMMAIIRNGLNDIHRYLFNPTQANIDKFNSAYTQAVENTVAHGTLPVLFTISKEADVTHDAGIDAANTVIRNLAAAYHAPLVVSNIDARHNPQYFAPDGEHNNTSGQVYMLSLMNQTLQHYFTAGAFAGG